MRCTTGMDVATPYLNPGGSTARTIYPSPPAGAGSHTPSRRAAASFLASARNSPPRLCFDVSRPAAELEADPEPEEDEPPAPRRRTTPRDASSASTLSAYETARPPPKRAWKSRNVQTRVNPI